MNGKQLEKWRVKLDLSVDELAAILSLSPRTIMNYEGQAEEIPRSVELACLAIKIGVRRYDGKHAFCDDQMNKTDVKMHKKLKSISEKTAGFLHEQK
jgi:transcriptional regulator with XRE-family HTH domain